MPRIDLDILNQKQTPAFYASSLATRPAAGFVGRIFIDSDSPSTGLYRDTGTAWVQIADPGAGSTGTLQQVTTNGSSTNVGISVTTNGIGIGTAIPGANLLDVHGTTGVLAQLENTTTNNSLLSFRNQGAGAWSIGNGYNAGANDFIIYDAVSFVNRFTIKGTGQTFIGSDTTSSGLLVVNTATSDSHIVVIGANAPSIRLRNTGTSPTLNAGLGISTATNNFIQGSASGNYCIFNSSTTASPILFGVYDSGAGNTQEAARISAARNFLIGTTTDSGYKLSVNGTSNFSAQLNGTTIQATGTYNVTNGTTTAFQSSVAFSYNRNLSTGAIISSTGFAYQWQRLMDISANIDTLELQVYNTSGSYVGSPIKFYGNGNTVFSGGTGNILIGTTTDTGYKLQVNGTTSLSDKLNGTGFSFSSSLNADWAGSIDNLGSIGANGLYINIGSSSTGIPFAVYKNFSQLFKVTNSGSIEINNSVAVGIAVASTHKVSIIIGGVQYYLLASNV